MVDGDIQNEDTPPLGRSYSDPLEFFNESPPPPAPPPSPQLSDLDVLALSAADTASFSWDAYVRMKAKAIYDQTILVRALFGALDGLIISYSTFKYIFDFITPANIASSDALHDWVVTGSGALAACAGSLTLITLSLVGNIFDDSHKNPLIRSMATLWPYVRDGFKGLKFAYKGVRSTVLVAQLMGFDLRAMIFPLGLVLGVAAAANRIWYRNQVTEQRKNFQKINNQLLKRAQNLGMNHIYDLEDGTDLDDQSLKSQKLYLEFDQEDGSLKYKVIDPTGQLVEGKLSLEQDLKFEGVNAQGEPVVPTIDFLKTHYRDKILDATANNGHTAIENNKDNRKKIRDAIKDETLLRDRTLVIASALFGGFVDGLYTYMGAMGLAILSPPLFGAMAVCCLIFTVICVVNRYYEEDQYQNEFLRSKLNVELVLAAKEMQATFFDIQRYSIRYSVVYQQEKKDREAQLTDSEAIQKKIEMRKEVDALNARMDSQLEVFKDIQRRYKEVYEVSTGRAILIGLRSGLYFYSAVSSIILAYAAFCATFPPALLVTAVAIGIVSLIAFAVHAYIVHDNHSKKAVSTPDKKNANLTLGEYVIEVKQTFAVGDKVQPVPPSEPDPLANEISIGPVPDLDYQPALEIIRSICSGLPKGNKGLDFVGEYWLEQDSQGHYQETTGMSMLGVGFSIFYAGVYGARAFGKGFRGANDVPRATLPASPTFMDMSGPSTPINVDNTLPSADSSPALSLEGADEQCKPLSSGRDVLEQSSPRVFNEDPGPSLSPSPSPSPSGGRWDPRMFATMGGLQSEPDLHEVTGLSADSP